MTEVAYKRAVFRLCAKMLSGEFTAAIIITTYVKLGGYQPQQTNLVLFKV